jgi:hypothetical protein
MKLAAKALCLILILIFIFPAAAANAAGDGYIESLTDKGFPEDYAKKLAVLHKKHPDWEFEPLDITGRSGGKYTWEYVVYMETEDNPKRSLVANSDQYTVLRDMSDPEQYDSGWWKASREAVEYMLDPRNFLDEKQIFQFYDLAWSDAVTLDAVEAAVKGTFMSDTRLDDKYSDTTYAEYFYQIGRELGASPVYLAARVRSEQGVNGTSSLINGKCGDKLWYYYSNKVTGSEGGHLIKAPTSGYTEEGLRSYNGLYNYFNIGAAGTGYFAIYLGGMNEAKKGTPEKSSEWGGPSWNTRWKSLYGGAYKATNTYINDYQNTPYLQKFNVDPRSSRNFWGQYMQSIHGSVGVATTFYNSFSENKMLDLPYTFLIPVYGGMPESCPYPDGTDFADKKYVGAKDVVKVDKADLSKLAGVKKSYPSAKASWRVFVGQTGSYLDLGKVDLSQYTGVCIEYSVSEKFDARACGTVSYIGLVSDKDHLYGGEGSAEDLSADLGHAKIKNGEHGYLHRKVININIENVNYDGNVYLNMYTQKNQKYLIHNVAFTVKKGYEPPEKVTEAAPAEATEEQTAEPVIAPVTEDTVRTESVTPAVTEEAGAENGVSAAVAIAVGVSSAVIAGGIAYIIILLNRKKPEGKQNEEK